MSDEFVVIAVFKIHGESGAFPGTEELAKRIAEVIAGERGLFMVYHPVAPVTKWYERPTPFKCHAKPGLVHFYHSPGDATFFKITSVTWEIDVFEVRGEWLKVNAEGTIWVKADECIGLE